MFIDTNYFLRYFLKDIPPQHEIAKSLFSEGTKGVKKLFTSTIVIFEIYWVFTSFYEKTKKEVIDILKKTLALNFIEIDKREVISKSVEMFENTSLDLEDCYNLIYAKERNAKEFKTFDKKLLNYLTKQK